MLRIGITRIEEVILHVRIGEYAAQGVAQPHHGGEYIKSGGTKMNGTLNS